MWKTENISESLFCSIDSPQFPCYWRCDIVFVLIIPYLFCFVIFICGTNFTTRNSCWTVARVVMVNVIILSPAPKGQIIWYLQCGLVEHRSMLLKVGEYWPLSFYIKMGYYSPVHGASSSTRDKKELDYSQTQWT